MFYKNLQCYNCWKWMNKKYINISYIYIRKYVHITYLLDNIIKSFGSHFVSSLYTYQTSVIYLVIHKLRLIFFPFEDLTTTGKIGLPNIK